MDRDPEDVDLLVVGGGKAGKWLAMDRAKAGWSVVIGPWTSETILRLDRIPDTLLILGGGYVGCEFASMFPTFGSRVVRSKGDRSCSRRRTRTSRQRWRTS